MTSIRPYQQITIGRTAILEGDANSLPSLVRDNLVAREALAEVHNPLLDWLLNNNVAQYHPVYWSGSMVLLIDPSHMQERIQLVVVPYRCRLLIRVEMPQLCINPLTLVRTEILPESPQAGLCDTDLIAVSFGVACQLLVHIYLDTRLKEAARKQGTCQAAANYNDIEFPHDTAEIWRPGCFASSESPPKKSG
jgi:hypothetical protein